MESNDSVCVTVEVPGDPSDAFRVFTEEIGSWYRSGTYYWADPERAKRMVLETRIDGRLLEIYDEAGHDYIEIGRIAAWEPGRRLVFSWRHSAEDVSQVEVRFTAAASGSAVALEHRGWASLSPSVAASRDDYRQAWTDLLRWYAETVVIG